MRVLVTGAGGLLGGRLATLLSTSRQVTAARHVEPVPAGLDAVPFDLLSVATMEAALDTARPEVVLHCAALADADRCEEQPDLAERLNAAGSESLAGLCGRRRIRLIAISTDLVFAGDRPFVKETDPATAPLVYARTKRMAISPGLRRAPDTIAASVSRIRCFVSRTTSTGSARCREAAM